MLPSAPWTPLRQRDKLANPHFDEELIKTVGHPGSRRSPMESLRSQRFIPLTQLLGSSWTSFSRNHGEIAYQLTIYHCCILVGILCLQSDRWSNLRIVITWFQRKDWLVSLSALWYPNLNPAHAFCHTFWSMLLMLLTFGAWLVSPIPTM